MRSIKDVQEEYTAMSNNITKTQFQAGNKLRHKQLGKVAEILSSGPKGVSLLFADMSELAFGWADIVEYFEAV